MNTYVTGKAIKKLRENRKMTQHELAEKLNISEQAISKWENGRGYPDIVILEDLAKSLDVSIIEILKGEIKVNNNICANMLKTRFYKCSVCGNVVTSTGELLLSCCGINMKELEVIMDDSIKLEYDNTELCVIYQHDMKKDNYVSFIAYVTSDNCSIKKLYPESECIAYFSKIGHGMIYVCEHSTLKAKKI